MDEVEFKGMHAPIRDRLRRPHRLLDHYPARGDRRAEWFRAAVGASGANHRGSAHRRRSR